MDALGEYPEGFLKSLTMRIHNVSNVLTITTAHAYRNGKLISVTGVKHQVIP